MATSMPKLEKKHNYDFGTCVNLLKSEAFDNRYLTKATGRCHKIDCQTSTYNTAHVALACSTYVSSVYSSVTLKKT